MTEPRGVLIVFHGNNQGTAEEMITGSSSWSKEGLGLGLVGAVVASPESIPEGSPTWLIGPEFDTGGTRAWYEADARLIHELLQSNFNSAFTLDQDRVVFAGGSQGTCFLTDFFEEYAGIYGGGLHARCGCFWGKFEIAGYQHPRKFRPWRPTVPWTETSSAAVRDRFRVFVEATTGDFLHEDAVAMERYYREILGLDTRSDLGSPGGHCARGTTPSQEILEWLSRGGEGIRREPEIQRDADGDGVPNDTDEDDDNDGAVDFADDLPLDAREYLDSDHDGIGDFQDRDADGDGFENADDAFPQDPREWGDFDEDGIGDNLDRDDDNDGLPDDRDPRLDREVVNDQLTFRAVKRGVVAVAIESSFPNSNFPAARVHSRGPNGIVYPAPEGDVQSYQVLTLGNGTNREFQIMIDRLFREETCEGTLLPPFCGHTDPFANFALFQHHVDRIYVDRNQNRDLTDDGPPMLLARNERDLFSAPGVHALLLVSYASGDTLPYGINLWTGPDLAHGVLYRSASVWIGYAELPGGAPVRVATVDANSDGVFDSGGVPPTRLGNYGEDVAAVSDFVCIDMDRNDVLDECDVDDNGDYPNAVQPGATAVLDGRTLTIEVSPGGHRVRFIGAR